MTGKQLQRAIDLAVAAHRGTEDPPGEPYILHPMRVMQRFDDPTLMAVAILHDTLERTKLTADDLLDGGMPNKVVKAVERLTHRDGVTYADYVVALKADPLARAVKLADLLDNADLRYVDFPEAKPKKGRRRVTRYAVSYRFLADAVDEKTYRRLMRDAEN